MVGTIFEITIIEELTLYVDSIIGDKIEIKFQISPIAIPFQKMRILKTKVQIEISFKWWRAV